MAYYGTLTQSNEYFAARLYVDVWEEASPGDKEKALAQAARIIDALNYRGVKATVYAIMYDSDACLLYPQPTQAEIMTADATQPAEFPRGADATVADQIRYAQYEIAYALADGWDADAELENYRVTRHSYASVRSTYDTDATSNAYILYGIPSGVAWRYLTPYLVETDLIKISRVD
jgi:hypothetical protein